MQIIPHFVLKTLAQYLPALLEWFSARIYADLLRKADDHLLVQVHERLDLTPIEGACAAYQHHTGPGAPPTHNIPQLVRALLVQQLYHWSQRETEQRIRFDLVVKWFVGYPLYAQGPDHSTLSRFEQWVDRCQHRTFFDEILHQIDAVFPDQRKQEQIGDTFALRADAAQETLIRLLRHTCQSLLRALRQADPARAARVGDAMHGETLYGPEQEMPEYRLNAAERAARLQTTVLAALDCAERVRHALDAPFPLPAPARTPVEAWLAHLHKLVEDNVHLKAHEPGAPTVTERPKKQKGAFRLGSATDPEATYRKHRQDSTLGYNVQMAVSDHFVREISAHTGAEPDEVSVPDLIVAQQEHHALTPPKLIYDAAAGKGKTFARVRKVSQGQTQLAAPVVSYHTRNKRFKPHDFSLSHDGTTLSCPNRRSSCVSVRSNRGQGRTFRFHHSLCLDCPLWDKCRSQEPGSTAYRQVFVSDYWRDVETARAYNQTPDFKADRKRRPRVERFVAELVRHNGARRARRRGLSAADFQAKGAALALNLKRWVRLKPIPISPAQFAVETSTR